LTENAADRIRSVDGVTTVIESIDLDKREHYLCAILRIGVVLVKVTPLSSNFSYQLSISRDNLARDIEQALKYDKALQQKRGGELEIERVERYHSNVVAAVNAVQNRA